MSGCWRRQRHAPFADRSLADASVPAGEVRGGGGSIFVQSSACLLALPQHLLAAISQRHHTLLASKASYVGGIGANVGACGIPCALKPPNGSTCTWSSRRTVFLSQLLFVSCFVPNVGGESDRIVLFIAIRKSQVQPVLFSDCFVVHLKNVPVLATQLYLQPRTLLCGVFSSSALVRLLVTLQSPRRRPSPARWTPPAHKPRRPRHPYCGLVAQR